MQITWGDRGEYNEWRLLGDGLSWGVLRETSPGVEYRPPKISGIRSWTKVGSRRYKMPLASADDMPPRETVAELRERLVKSLVDPAVEPAERHLQAIDDAVLGLIRLAIALHEQQQALGAIHPENVILLETGDSTEIVLPDWGFFWAAGFATMPAWLNNNAWRFLWDVDLQQANLLDQQGVTSIAVGRDAHTLARVIIWLLLGEEAVGAWSDPHAEAPAAVTSMRAGSAEGAEAWEAITAALAAPETDFKSAGEALANLEKALEKWRPSQFFHGLRAISRELAARRARARRWVIARRVIAAALVVALSGLAWSGYRSLPDPPPPPPLCDDCHGTTALRPGLEKLSEARKAALVEGGDSKAEVQALADLFATPLSPQPSFAAKEAACLERLGRATLESVERDYKRLKKRLNEMSEDPLVDCPLIDQVFESAETVMSFLPQEGSPPWFDDLRDLRRLHCDR